MSAPSPSSSPPPPDLRRMYSWWWDSHIVPKNSRWLQENLTDIESKIKGMIKIIELDADSFGRKAEMYYQKRPELRTLVEDFYRTYRALAERYDRQAGDLRHAHRAIAQAFPDRQLSFFNLADADDLPPGSQDDAVQEEPLIDFAAARDGEVKELQETVSRLEAERDDAVEQCRRSSAMLAGLKAEVIRTQQEFRKFRETMSAGGDDERCVALESELEKTKRLAAAQKDDMEKLAAVAQEERRRRVQADMELDETRMRLEVSDRHWTARVVRLQDEKIALIDARRQLEDDLARRAEEAKAAQAELARAMADRSDFERRHSDLAEQMQAVSLNVGALREIASELRDGNAAKAALEAEHAALLVRVHGLAAKNQLLENSLSDANAELDSLRAALAGVTETAGRLEADNAALRGAKKALADEVESLGWSLMRLERRFAEFGDEHSELLRERHGMLAQVAELRRQGESRVSSLEKKVRLLRDDGDRRERLLVAAEEKVVEAQTGIFVLRRALLDMAAAAAARAAEVQYLSQRNRKLVNGARRVAEALKLDVEDDDGGSDVVFDLAANEIRFLMAAVADGSNARQQEQSLAGTLLEHLGQEVAALREERNTLKDELLAGRSEASVLRNELLSVAAMNEDLEAEAERSAQELCAMAGHRISAEVLAVVFRSLHGERVRELHALQEKLKLIEDLRGEVEALRIGAMDYRRRSVGGGDEEIAKLRSNISAAIADAELFSEKVVELIVTCESFEAAGDKDAAGAAGEIKDEADIVGVKNQSLKVDLSPEKDFAAPSPSAAAMSSRSELKETENDGARGPSEMVVVEKEMCIDREELPSNDSGAGAAAAAAARQEWKKQVVGRLYADAERLVALQYTIQELKLTAGDAAAAPASFRGVELAISQLVETNNTLWKESEAAAAGVVGSARRREISEWAWKASEDIAAVEAELQGVRQQLELLKETTTAGEEKAAAGAAEPRPRTPLADYLTGGKPRRDGAGKPKRRRGCGCLRSKTAVAGDDDDDE